MPTTVRLSPEAEARLDRLAAITGRNKAFYLRRLVEDHLDDLEDVCLGEQRLESLRAGSSDTVQAGDVWGDQGD